MTKACFLLMLLHVMACHPFFMFKPKALKPSLAALSEAPVGDPQKILIAVDEFGIPFVKAHDEASAVYTLGFLHARDRLFQLDFIRHAALGRAAELFGDKALDYDRKLRMLSYRLKEQLEKLSQNERDLLKAYVRGVNDGAKQRGKSAEHFLLGIDFEELTELHVVAIARLQSWTLGSDIVAELSRLRLAQSPLFEAVKNDYVSVVDDHHTGIVSSTKEKPDLTRFVVPRYPKKSPIDAVKPRALVEDLAQFEDGASNAWAIEAGLMSNNHAVLMNDPHLRHTWPSNFYLATLSYGDVQVTGASFVGLPAILIGAGKNVSWGVTASYLNTQDSVLLKPHTNKPLTYMVDDKEHDLTPWPQQFCVNKKGKCNNEDFYISIFGPVMDHRHDAWIDKDDRLAVMWTGFLVEEHDSLLTAFFALSDAKTVAEAEKISKTMTLPGVNMLFADVKGDIAYSYAGLVPERDITQHPFLPLDGGTAQSLWKNFLKKPVLKHPEEGFIVTANQNIFDKDAGAQFFFGQQGAAPFRAMRIKEKIKTMKEEKSLLNADALLALQLDSVSLEAQSLAQKLGSFCALRFKESPRALKKQFAELIENFDGNFTVKSNGALPYEVLLEQLMVAQLSPAIGQTLAYRALYVSHLNNAFKQNLIKSMKQDDPSLKEFVMAQCEPGFDLMVKRYGGSVSKWRYGKHHYLERQSPLAQAPIVGMLFKDKKREVAGNASSVLAEVGTPVMYGANLRFQAVMSNPVQLKFVLDSGNSGVVGEKNSLDQAELWHQGKMIDVITDWQVAWQKARNRFELDYQSSSTSSSSSKS